MKTISKRLLSIITATVISSGLFATSNVSAATVDNSDDVTVKTEANQLASIYKTNPNGDKSVGKEKTITIDGDASDWSEDLLIAQGAANDSCTAFKGQHENCVLDSYSLYAAWDDDNLYIGWQMVNSTDIWAREGDGPLSDGGRVLDVPLGIALSIDPSKKMTGKLADGKGIWGLMVEYQTPMDHLLLMSGKPGLGEPAMFTPNEDGSTSYTKGVNCFPYKTSNIKYAMAETSIPDKIMGVDNPSGVEDIYSDSSNWINFLDKGHNRKYDSFYEMSIPLSELGIDKNYIETKGIGALQIATRGESGIDCLPHDDSMLDNATEDYGGANDNTSHEKDDTDIITTKLADIGKIRDGHVTVRPNIDAVNTNVTSPQDLGSTVKFTTLASSGTGTLQYQYEVNGVVAQSYSTNSIFNWTPKVEGDYSIKVTVKDSEGETSTKTVSYTINKPESNLTITATKTSLASPQLLGSTIKLSMAAKGEGTVKYRFVALKDGVVASFVRGYKTSGYVNWTPEEAGNYTIYFKAKDSTGKEVTKTMNYVVNKPVEALSINSIKASVVSPQKVGTTIKLTTDAVSTGTMKYKYWVCDPEGDWTLLRGYGAKSSVDWTPRKAGTYVIFVDVKDSNGNVKGDFITYKVTK